MSSAATLKRNKSASSGYSKSGLSRTSKPGQLTPTSPKTRSGRKKVESRDDEIGRLSRLLETGRPHESIATEARIHSSDRVVDHLQLQVEYLTQSNRELEERLRRAIERRAEAADEAVVATEQKAALLTDLRSAGSVAAKLEREREAALDIADKEVADAKEEIYRSQTELKMSEQNIDRINTENDKLRAAIERQKRDKQKVETNLSTKEEMLERAEKIRLEQQQRIEELSNNERDLLMQLEKLRLKKGGKPGQANGAVSPTRLNQMLKSIEQERDFYKKENDKLAKRAKSPTRKSEAKQADQYESVIRALEDERDYYKRECERSSQRALAASPTRVSRSPVRETLTRDTEIRRLTRERNELQAMLDKFERHMGEIQTNVKILTGERDKTQNLYAQSSDEVQRLRRELIKQPKSAKASAAAQAILARVEGERDEAINDLRRISVERDSVRERLANEHSQFVSDKARLQQEVDDLTNRLRPCEAERDDLLRRVASLRDTVAQLEDEVKAQSMRIRAVDDEAHEFKGESSQLRLLLDQTEKSLADCKHRLDKKTAEFGASEDNRAQQQVDIHSLQNHLRKEKEESSRLRGVIATIDHEKDLVQSDLDLRTEKVARLTSELDSRTLEVNKLLGDLADAEQQILSLNDSVTARDREVKSLSRQVETRSYENADLSRVRDALNTEVKRLQDDLAEMTRECQSLAQQLSRTEEERDELKSKVFSLHKEVQRQEDMGASLEQEKAHLLSSYRHAQNDAARYESDAQTAHTELSAARLEIVSKEGEIRRLEEKLREFDRDIKDHQEAGAQYESQLSQQSSNLAHLERQLHATQQERDATLADLAAVRELCVKLDSSKDTLSRQLAHKNIEADQLGNTVQDCRQEIDMLKKQIDSENATIRTLEDLLTKNREKEFAAQLSSQERETEVQLYKERLKLSENNSASLQREIQSVKTRLGTSEAELERTRRQLTNERFEHERAEQDLRRIKQGRGPSPSRAPRGSSSVVGLN